MFQFKARHLSFCFALCCTALTFGLSASEAHCYKDCCPDPTPSCCYPTCNEESCYFVSADVFIGTVCQTDLDYAVENARSDNKVDKLGFKTYVLDYNWRAGFRVTGGYRFCDNDWDARIVYTYFRPKATGSASLTGRPVLHASMWHGDSRADTATNASGSHTICYNVVDFLASHPFCVSKALLLRPFFGVRALFMEQNLRVDYRGDDFASENHGPGFLRYKACFDGAGPHIGFAGEMLLGCGYKLIWRASSSILAGDAKTRHRQTQPEITNFIVVDLKEDQCIPAFNYELSIGAVKECCYCNIDFNLYANYEFSQWMHTQQQRRYGSSNEGVSNPANGGTFLRVFEKCKGPGLLLNELLCCSSEKFVSQQLRPFS